MRETEAAALFENIIPLFEKGRILKKELLDNLRDFPRNTVQILLSGYSDGIVAGFGIRYENGHIFVSSGLLKHDGLLYLLNQEILLPCSILGQDCSVRFSVRETEHRADCMVENFQIGIVEKSWLQYGDYTLGDFHLKEGAVLRTCDAYRDFQDAGTLINTLNLIDVKYAGKENSTMAPVLLRYYAGEVLKAGSRTSLDEAFCLLCLNSQLMEKDTMLQYLAAQGRCLPESADNRELYNQLLAVWRSRKHDRGAEAQAWKKTSRKTFIE